MLLRSLPKSTGGKSFRIVTIHVGRAKSAEWVRMESLECFTPMILFNGGVLSSVPQGWRWNSHKIFIGLHVVVVHHNIIAHGTYTCGYDRRVSNAWLDLHLLTALRVVWCRSWKTYITLANDWDSKWDSHFSDNWWCVWLDKIMTRKWKKEGNYILWKCLEGRNDVT
jgi:hypothetical protein